MDGGAEELGRKPSEADPPQPQNKQQTMLLEGSSSVLNQQGKGRKGGSIASHPKTKSSPCQREDCQGGETEIYSGPSLPERLGYLEVIGCSGLKVIESNAPNISSLYFSGDHRVQLSLGDTLQMKSLHMSFSGAVRYARVALPSTMPNLETATIYSSREADTPMLHSRYLHLKNLTIMLSAATFPATYDYFSLVSFLDACPSLEALALDVSQRFMEHVSIFSDPSDLRLM